ncbi:hypothetical protein [Frankia sp. AgKG'84/4]|uniref:hypothetical protein n=1 Tax=Frankia sp. AgKG'84/4 TaxID=573490 RepID=UPI00200F3586|nr:hypothetical protein [Frankia sp. AgKG'84/4]MCL9795599.1 hypothetical protein [Frankia sp. AgKG'84/4]
MIVGCSAGRPAPPPHLPPGEIARRAQAAFADANTAHVLGTVRDGAQRFAFDARYTGADSDLTIDHNGRYRVRRVGAAQYLWADQAFWDATVPAASAALAARWWTGSFPPPPAGVADFSTRSSVVSSLRRYDWAHGQAAQTTLHGHTVIHLTAVAAGESTTSASLYVEKDGAGRPLRFEEPDESLRLDFQDYDQPYRVQKPADVLDLSAAVAQAFPTAPPAGGVPPGPIPTPR